MREQIDELLASRARRGRRRGEALSLGAALALHAAVVIALVGAPRLLADREPMPEFVPVTIMPLQALGIEEPKPPKREPVQKPEPEPEPPAPEPEPEPEPPPADLPVLPAPEEEKKPRPAATQPADESGPAGRLGAPTGNPAGQSAFGTAVAGLDNPDFTYGYYIDQMLSSIRANWVRPPLGSGVEAVVHFVISSDGRISEVELVTSSGYSSFDLAGLRAVQSASPLPPLPRSYRRDELGVSLVIR